MHGIGDEQDGHAAVEQCEVAHDAKNRLLLGAFDMRGANEFGAAPEFCARARRDDFSYRLAPPDKRAGISLKARPGLNWDGFAGERQLHHITLHQFGRRQCFPDAVAPRRCLHGQT